MITIALFINNYRINDNRVLQKAIDFGQAVLPVIPWQKSRHNKTWFNWSSMGPFRYQFLKKTIVEFKANCSELV